MCNHCVLFVCPLSVWVPHRDSRQHVHHTHIPRGPTVCWVVRHVDIYYKNPCGSKSLELAAGSHTLSDKLTSTHKQTHYLQLRKCKKQNKTNTLTLSPLEIAACTCAKWNEKFIVTSGWHTHTTYGNREVIKSTTVPEWVCQADGREVGWILALDFTSFDILFLVSSMFTNMFTEIRTSRGSLIWLNTYVTERIKDPCTNYPCVCLSVLLMIHTTQQGLQQSALS